MAYLTGAYWDHMHMTFDAHVDGLYAAAKRAKLEGAREWLKAAKRYNRDGRDREALWAAINGAEELAIHWRNNCIGYVDAGGE